MTLKDIGDRPVQVQIGAGLLLLLASLFAVYRWHYAPAAIAASELGILSDMLRIEADNASRVKPLEGGTSGATIPELLSVIQQAAGSHNVAVRSVAPNPVDPTKISLGLHGDFRDMMAFLGRLETFQITLGGFDFAPDEAGGINATVEIQHTAKPGAPSSFADYLDALVSYTAIRNPFEAGDPVPLPNTGADLGDLTWSYHLTSISLFGAMRVATIDGKDYRTGDHLGDLTVTAIGPSSVSLIAQGPAAAKQALVQKIHFRRNAPATSPGNGGRRAD
jgi:hypothetical protein